MKRFFRGLFRSIEQTSDKSLDPTLRSRYFRISKEQIWPLILDSLTTERDLKMTHEVRSAGEILLTRRTFTGRVQDITISVLQINPLKTSVDIYSASRDSYFLFGDMGSNYRVIQRILRTLEQSLEKYRLPNG